MSMCSVFGLFSRRQPGTRKPALPRFLHLVLAACLLAGANQALAQTRSNGNKSGHQDKSKGMTRLMDHYRAKLQVKDDAEWKIIEERIAKVLRANRELQTALFAANFKNSSSSNKHPGKSTASGGTGEPGSSSKAEAYSDVRALKKLVETKASSQEIKAGLARVRAMLRDQQEKLTAAQEELRAVLSTRQEAIAVLNGLLR